MMVGHKKMPHHLSPNKVRARVATTLCVTLPFTITKFVTNFIIHIQVYLTTRHGKREQCKEVPIVTINVDFTDTKVNIPCNEYFKCN